MSIAKLTLIGINNYDNSLFDNLRFENVDHETMVNTILLNCGEFEVLYPNIETLKNMFTLFSSKWSRTVSKWVSALNTEYKPLENYDRYENFGGSETELENGNETHLTNGNETITNNFGITAFEIANAVRPDTAIMCVPYEGYDSGFLKMIQTSSKYKLDMQVDCFNMANKHFDVARSKEEKKLSFITTGADLVDKRIEDLKRDTEIPIYNSLNVTSALEMYSYIVNKLSESDFGTVS